ncbi:Mitochondrial import inner membrane translocase subunit tim-8 [Paragonimus heterotremus]|uniref:Mitochondrial import inner membrane translocase subunit n=1 Tax=Paragonimus heterotremus TaxID=100268 RepID=A0A8J4SNH4_9TREM|nr:Mitochondrial import inner membrane translocase subunit tim-8 [Paragonimus heterotremus]
MASPGAVSKLHRAPCKSDTMDADMQRRVLQEMQNQKFQHLSHQLTSVCWDRCVTKLSTSLDSKVKGCIENCVERYIDVSGAISRQQNRNRMTFADVEPAE